MSDWKAEMGAAMREVLAMRYRPEEYEIAVADFIRIAEAAIREAVQYEQDHPRDRMRNCGECGRKVVYYRLQANGGICTWCRKRKEPKP